MTGKKRELDSEEPKPEKHPKTDHNEGIGKDMKTEYSKRKRKEWIPLLFGIYSNGKTIGITGNSKK
jgi:hypothetical protein